MRYTTVDIDWIRDLRERESEGYRQMARQQSWDTLVLLYVTLLVVLVTQSEQVRVAFHVIL